MTKEELYNIVEDTVERICDDYCKYPSICSNDELDDVCDGCPLHQLRELEGCDVS